MITDLHRPAASPVPATSPPPTRTPPPARPHLNFCHSHCLPTFYCGWDKWTHSWTHRGLLRPALQGAWALGTHQGRTWTKVPPSKMTASWPVSETPETRASLPRVDSRPRHPRTECSSPSALGRAGRQLQRLPRAELAWGEAGVLGSKHWLRCFPRSRELSHTPAVTFQTIAGSGPPGVPAPRLGVSESSPLPRPLGPSASPCRGRE